MVRDLGAQAVRSLFMGSFLEGQIAAAKSGPLPKHFQAIKDLSDAGIPVIASIAWLRKRETRLPAPNSDPWHRWLQTARDFVTLLAPYLAGISLDNEPITAYAPAEYLPNRSGVVPAIAWFRDLAAAIRQTAPHLLISSPGLNTLDSLRTHPKSPMAAAVEKFFDWARNDSNIDVVDIHAHFNSVQTVEAVLDEVQGRFPRGIVVLEWSQTQKIRGWDSAPLDPGFAARWKRNGALQNGDYVLQCEAHPTAGADDSRVSLAEWNDFVATAPVDADYMANAFDAMKKHGVLMAAYGGARQYGNRLFDVTQLYANLTVPPLPDGRPQPNYKFADWFKAIAAAA